MICSHPVQSCLTFNPCFGWGFIPASCTSPVLSKEEAETLTLERQAHLISVTKTNIHCKAYKESRP